MSMDLLYALVVAVIIVIVNCSNIYAQSIQHIRIATIVTNNNSYMFSINHVRPAIEYAIDKVHEQRFLPAWLHIHVNYSDSHCNTKDGPIAAFNYYGKEMVDVFFGPVCDYSLAPVARYAPYWNLPVISPGGFAHDFSSKTALGDPEFPTLTRVGLTFNSLAWAIIDTFKYHNWTRMILIYDSDGHSEVSPKFCYLAGSAFIHYFKKYNIFRQHDMLLHQPSDDFRSMLKDKVGNTYASIKNPSLQESAPLPITGQEIYFRRYDL